MLRSSGEFAESIELGGIHFSQSMCLLWRYYSQMYRQCSLYNTMNKIVKQSSPYLSKWYNQVGESGVLFDQENT